MNAKSCVNTTYQTSFKQKEQFLRKFAAVKQPISAYNLSFKRCQNNAAINPPYHSTSGASAVHDPCTLQLQHSGIEYTVVSMSACCFLLQSGSPSLDPRPPRQLQERHERMLHQRDVQLRYLCAMSLSCAMVPGHSGFHNLTIAGACACDRNGGCSLAVVEGSEIAEGWGAPEQLEIVEEWGWVVG